MNHLTVQEMFDYTAGGLSVSRRGAIEEHLAACPACRAQLAFERSLIDGVRSSTGAPSPSLTAAIMKEIESVKPATAIPRMPLFFSRLLLGAVGAALAAAALFLPSVTGPVAKTGQENTLSTEFFGSAWDKIYLFQNSLARDMTALLGAAMKSPTLLVCSYAVATFIVLWLLDRHVASRILHRRTQ